MALRPTFLMAVRPKRMALPCGVKSASEKSTSGGSTGMFISRHSLMYLTTFSGFEISDESSAAMNSIGIVGFEIGRLIGDQRVGRGVRLIEAVSGELRHQIEDLADCGFGMAESRSTAHEAVALLGHRRGIFFAHGAAQQIGLAQGVAGEDVGDPHHLLLIDDDAERVFENSLELRQQELHFAASPLALDEVVDHIHRSGTVERIQRGQILDRVGLVAAQNVAHAGRFKLKDAGGERGVKDPPEGLGIVQRDHLDVQLSRRGSARSASGNR